MAEIGEKVKNVLDEARLLVLGVQVLVGFQYRAAFEPAFPRLSSSQQINSLIALALLLVSLGFLLAPTSCHQLLEQGNDTERIHGYATRMTAIALLPFALGLGLEVSIVAGRILSGREALIPGTFLLILAVTMWYVLGWAQRRDGHEGGIDDALLGDSRDSGYVVKPAEPRRTPLKDKIVQVLTEARIVVPGAQALLGFQFLTFLADGFDSLPTSSKYVHFASLMFTALSVICLMTPAAYHRIAERGEDSSRLHRLGSRMLLIAMLALALGLTGDFYIVARKITGSVVIALVAAASLNLLFDALWFLVPIVSRKYGHESPMSGSSL